MFRTSSLVAPAQFRRRGLIVWHGLQWMAVLLWRPSKNYPKKCSWEHLATKMYRKICPKRGFNQQHQLRNFRASKPFFHNATAMERESPFCLSEFGCGDPSAVMSPYLKPPAKTGIDISNNWWSKTHRSPLTNCVGCKNSPGQCGEHRSHTPPTMLVPLQTTLPRTYHI